jgi:hypothetical protein
MGDDSPIEVSGQGRVDLKNGSFDNVLHVLKLVVNILFVYQITHSSIGKRDEFILNPMTVYEMEYNSQVDAGEVNH